MPSVKRIGFLWSEEKITLVEYNKNGPAQIYSTPLGSKNNIASPFSSNLTEDIQITALLQKMLKDNRIAGRSFYVSLGMKEIILRSFIIPYVGQDDIQSAIKFEAKKYLPIDIQDLAFVFYSTPFTENKVKRLQIIFFAVRKELLNRYEHIFNQVNAIVSHCEPCMVSLAKVLLSKKEINAKDNIAFLILDNNLGRICFIDQGIPQFIREFFVNPQSSMDGSVESPEALNLKIVNEVANSFDFYVRQFSGDRIEQMLVSADGVGSQELFNALETELKIKIRKISPITSAGDSQGNDMDAMYAMGACIDPPIPTLSGINFLEEKTSKSKFEVNFVEFVKFYKEVILIFVMCVIFLVGINILFQVQSKVGQLKYNQLSSKEGGYMNVPVTSIQSDVSDSTDKLASYKNIRTKSNVVLILLKIASHVPKGAMLRQLTVEYNQSDYNDIDAHVTIDMQGDVVEQDADAEIAAVNQIYSDFKNDKELSQFVKNVNLVTLNHSDTRTDFNIHCS